MGSGVGVLFFVSISMLLFSWRGGGTGGRFLASDHYHPQPHPPFFFFQINTDPTSIETDFIGRYPNLYPILCHKGRSKRKSSI